MDVPRILRKTEKLIAKQIRNGVNRERKLFFKIRLKLLKENLLPKQKQWIESNIFFLKTLTDGTVEVPEYLIEQFDILVSDIDGAIESPVFRSKSEVSKKRIFQLLKPNDTIKLKDRIFYYSANTFSKKDPKPGTTIRESGKFIGGNNRIIEIIIEKLKNDKKLVYIGSSDFDLVVILQVIEKLEEKNSLDLINNLYFCTTSRKFI